MIKIVYSADTSGYDLAGTGNIELSNDLRTPILISLLTNKRVDDQGGWWGSEYSSVGGEWGSRVWQVMRTARDATFANRLRDACKEALQWLIDREIASGVDISVTTSDQGLVLVAISVTGARNPRYNGVWELSLEL